MKNRTRKGNELTKTKKLTALVLGFLLVFAIALEAMASTTSITGPNKAKAGPDATKTSATAEPSVNLSSWTNCHSSIIFWVYKNGTGQASGTYTFLSTGNKAIFYLDNTWKVKDALYHSVWKTNGSVGATEVASVSYTFVP